MPSLHQCLNHCQTLLPRNMCELVPKQHWPLHLWHLCEPVCQSICSDKYMCILPEHPSNEKQTNKLWTNPIPLLFFSVCSVYCYITKVWNEFVVPPHHPHKFLHALKITGIWAALTLSGPVSTPAVDMSKKLYLRLDEMALVNVQVEVQLCTALRRLFVYFWHWLGDGENNSM